MKKITIYIDNFIAILSSIINYLDRSTLNIANIEIAAAFNISSIERGILLSVFMWPYALASLPARYLVDWVVINKVMLISMITWSLTCVLGGLVVGFYSILITRLLLGVAEVPIFL